MAIAGSTSNQEQEKDFTFAGVDTFIDNLTPQAFLAACLEENTRRMSRFDEGLLQPQLLRAIAKVALNTLNLLPSRQHHPGIAKS